MLPAQLTPPGYTVQLNLGTYPAGNLIRVQWETQAMLLSYTATDIKVSIISNNTVTTVDNANFLAAGKGTGSNSTTLVTGSLSKMVCAYAYQFQPISNPPNNDPTTWNRTFLGQNVKAKNPERRYVVLSEATSATLIKIRILSVTSGGTLTYHHEFHHTITNGDTFRLTGCSEKYYAVKINHNIQVFDLSNTLIKTYTGTSGRKIHLGFLTDEALILAKEETIAGTQKFNLYEAHTVSETPTELEILLPTSATVKQTADFAYIGVDYTGNGGATAPLLTMIQRVSNYISEDTIFEQQRLSSVESNNARVVNARGLFLSTSNTQMQVLTINESFYMDNGNDYRRYTVDWLTKIDYTYTTLPAADTMYTDPLFDTQDTLPMLIIRKGTTGAQRSLRLFRVLSTELKAVCTITAATQKPYANEIPIFYKEASEGRFGYLNSFSFLITNTDSDKFGWNIYDIIVIYLIVISVLILIGALVLMYKAKTGAEGFMKISTASAKKIE